MLWRPASPATQLTLARYCLDVYAPQIPRSPPSFRRLDLLLRLAPLPPEEEASTAAGSDLRLLRNGHHEGCQQANLSIPLRPPDGATHHPSPRRSHCATLLPRHVAPAQRPSLPLRGQRRE